MEGALIHLIQGAKCLQQVFRREHVPLSSITCERRFLHHRRAALPSRNDQKYRDFPGSFVAQSSTTAFLLFLLRRLAGSDTVINRSAHLETPAFEKYVQQMEPNSIAAKIFSTPGMATRISTTVCPDRLRSLITNPSDRNSTRLAMGISPKAVGQRSGTDRTGFPIGVSTTFGLPNPAAATSTTAAWITPWEQNHISPALTLLAEQPQRGTPH